MPQSEFFANGMATMDDVLVARGDVDGDRVAELFVMISSVIYGNSVPRTLFFQRRGVEWVELGDGRGRYYVSDEWENGYSSLYQWDHAYR